MPGTQVTITILEVVKGEAEPGSVISFHQTGGTVGGVAYVNRAAPLPAAGKDYLLFLDGADQKFVVGGGAGMYVKDDEGFSAVTDAAPTASVSREMLDLLMSSAPLTSAGPAAANRRRRVRYLRGRRTALTICAIVAGRNHTPMLSAPTIT